MTLLGVKWSPIAEHALDLVDCVEVAGWSLDGTPRSHPLLLHNIDLDFSLARPEAIGVAWADNARQLIAQTGTPWLSMHLGFSAEVVSFDDHMHPKSDVLDRQDCLERFTKALCAVQEAIDVPLLIENLDYCPEGAYEHVCEPAFTREVVEEVDCSLLLDVAHARVSADWLGCDIGEYLEALPLERVMQMHLSSPRRNGDRLDDGHYELLDEDYRLFERLLSCAQPLAVVLEYTRDVELLRTQLTELDCILRSHTR